MDAFNFAVLTLQIILFDTDYSEQVKNELEQKEQNATLYVVALCYLFSH